MAAVAAAPLLLTTPAFALANVTRADSATAPCGRGQRHLGPADHRRRRRDGDQRRRRQLLISRSGYTPPADCTVDVNDGSARPTTVPLKGAPPPPTRPRRCCPGPRRPRVFHRRRAAISSPLVNFPGSIGPTSWQIIAGALPPGLTMAVPTPTARPLPNTPQQLTYALIEGTPTGAGHEHGDLPGDRRQRPRLDPYLHDPVNPAAPRRASPRSPGPRSAVGSFTNLWIDGSGGLTPTAGR